MRILGIDPGTATTGYGVIDVKKKSIKVIEFGLIETDKNGEASKRLLEINKQLKKILKEKKPDVMAIERLFFATNAKTAMRVGQAQGIMMFSAAQTKTKVFEYAPGMIKKTVAGNGRADKKDIQKSLRKVLGAGVRSRKRKKTHFDNSADALAVALCHAYKSGRAGERESKS